MSAKNSTTNTNNASALDKAHEAAELSDAHLDTASKVWPDVFDDDSSSNSSGHSSNGQSASTAATSEASTQDNKERLPSDHCIPEHEDEGFETPKGSQSRSRRASMDTSMYPSNHRPSAAVLGFDSSLRRSDLSPNRSPNNPQSDGHDTPKRSGSSTSTSTALCRKASTMAPEDVDAAPPLQKRRTQTDDNDEAMDKGENLPVKASTTEKQCLRRFCV